MATTPLQTPIKSDYDILQEMAEEVSALLKEMSGIQVEKSTAILFIKEKCKTWREAEFRWASTEKGKREIELEYLLRGYKERMSALRARINSNRAY